jgi:DNA-binding NarL/FixJ family response regulator
MPLKILVVDDDLGTCLAIKTRLEMSDYSVVTAADGWEALARVKAQRPDLIVTDIVMPRMNGYELVQSLRQQPALRLIPVIFLTVQDKIEERIQGYQSGADLYLPKPFDLTELLAAIRNRLERAQMCQEAWLPSKQSKAVTTENPKLPSYLTQREWEVLALVTHGLSNAKIGTRLHLSSKTVEKYVSSLLRKTETSNRAELVGWFMKRRLSEQN